MKMSALAVICGSLFLVTSCDQGKVTEIDTKTLLANLDNPNYLIIDSRQDSLYNGFKDQNAIRGGHIKGAMQFTADWLDYISPDKLASFAEDKGITKDKTLVIYDSNLDNLDRVSAEFAALGYKVRVFKDFINYANADYPLEAFPNFALSVSPQWLNAALQGKNPETFNQKPLMVFEVSWGDLPDAKSYTQHIVGAYHFNTDWIENAPVWNLSDPKVIEANLLKNGITKDKTVVLYSENQLAALRVFWALKWAGVEDVRFLNGGLTGWVDADLPTETQVNTPTPETVFGTKIPAYPEINISMPDDVMREQQAHGLKLISNRSWDEYTGKITGYDYIPRKGEPEGAIWGFAGTDASNLADYYDPDNTLRNPLEIAALWASQGIHKGDYLAFYCGTGWRASVPWFMTELMGWPHTFVYDGGWNAWQMDSKYPVQKGAPNNMQKPNAHNDFGKVQKQGKSCKS